jgi:Ice-binding-like
MAQTIDQILASADNFAVLAGSAITNSGNTVITGANLGLSPGTSVTGFPPGVVTPPAVQHITDSVAAQAQSDLTAAYLTLAAMGPATPIVGALDGQTFTPGTYSGGAILLNVGATVTLNGAGTYVFQAASSLTIGNGSTVLLTGGATAANVAWQVTSSASIGTTAVFVGDIVALTSITVNTGATITGRLLARNGLVSLLGNAITAPASGASTTSSVAATATLSELCFPDITGKTIRAWGIVTLSAGGYTIGGIPFGLMQFADVRTVDFNGFLRCEVYGEDPLSLTSGASPLYTYHYSPVNDALQIFNNGVELTASQSTPAAILADVLLFEATWDRTTVRG